MSQGRNQEECKKIVELNEDENKTSWNLWDTMKVILSKKLIALSAFINSVKISQIKMIYLKVLGGKQIQQSKQTHREQ